MPGIVEIVPFKINIDGQEISFSQLRFKKEAFMIAPSNRNAQIHQLDILNNNSDEVADLEKLMDSSAYSIAIETVATTGLTYKAVTRVVLLNDKGQRTLDTLVCPVKLKEPEKYVLKDGLKSQLFKLAQTRGPSITEVIKVMNHIIKDKKLVGYHLPMKLADIGIIGQMQMKSQAEHDNMVNIINSKFSNESSG